MPSKKIVTACDQCDSEEVRKVSEFIFECLNPECGVYFETDTFETHKHPKKYRPKQWDDDDWG